MAILLQYKVMDFQQDLDSMSVKSEDFIAEV